MSISVNVHQESPQVRGAASTIFDQRPGRAVAFGASFSLTVHQRTPAFFRLRPTTLNSLHDEFVVESDLDIRTLVRPDIDLAAAGGRSCQLLDRTVLEPGTTRIRYRGELAVDGHRDPMPAGATAPRLEELKPDEWLWLQPSRYCRPDVLGAEAWAMFGHLVAPGEPATGETVRAVCTYVDQNMAFEYGTTSGETDATDAWQAKRGVCRDYNHIAVSFCRALNIPARYAFGYLPDIDVPPSASPMDFCAWFEAFLDGAWWAFDARVNEPRIGRIVVARGRDAADVPMISTLGQATLTDFAVHAGEIASTR